MMNQFDSLHDEVDSLETVEGITPLSAATLPDPFGTLLRKLIRKGSMTVDEIAAELDLDPEQAQHLGRELAAKGYLREEEQEASGGTIFRVFLARIRPHSISLDL